MRKLTQIIGVVEDWIGAGLVALIVGLVLAQVVCRRVLARPLVWSEELATYAFMAVTLIGAAAAVRRREHIRLDLIANRLPERTRKWIEHAGSLLTLVVVLGLVPGSLRFCGVVARQGLKSPAFGLPMVLIYGLVPLALVLIAVHLAARCFGREA